MNAKGKMLMELWGKRLIYLDGGMGTMLQAAGLAGGEKPESWNLLHPEKVKEVHLAYLRAGCDIVTANTFGATREHLGEEAEGLMTAGVKLAVEATQEAGHGWAAIDISSLGRLMQPYGDMDFEEAVGQFREAVRVGLDAGGDLVLIETMTDLLEAKAAVLGAKEAMAELEPDRLAPIFCSFTFDEKGRLLTGADIRGAAAMLCGLGVDAVGMNCGLGPAALMDNARELLRWCEKPVFISPNASLPVVRDGVTVYPTTSEAFGQEMAAMAALGAEGLGGCCGTTPAHINAMVRATQKAQPEPRKKKNACVICGRSMSVALGMGQPLLIGERINPAGKPRLQQALLEKDIDALLDEALEQVEAGANALDVNVTWPQVDEAAMLREVIPEIQAVCGAPLQLDTADPIALEAGLRVYAGKPLINSICGTKQVMDEVLPLAANYGGVVVALLLDEEGIPATVEGRLAIARRIIAEAARYGIAKTELLFDALTLTASTNELAARITLETVARLQEELGVKTLLGVSNVSYGLPRRPLLTAAFTAMAIGRGLSAAILNPLDQTVKEIWDAAIAVSGRDPSFGNYLAAYGGEEALAAAPQAMAPGEGAAALAIVQGQAQQASSQIKAMLDSGRDPLGLVEECIMPALAQVGEKYEKGGLFLPQLLQSAQAAEAAFAQIHARLPDSQGAAGGTVVLAAVQGDVHDIGKNIVKVLLQSHGFAVVDLGRDVAPGKVLEAVKQTGAKLVGLSALMTTTMPAMAETVALLQKEAPQTHVMVGGAALSLENAQNMGAESYGKDAMAAVRLAQRFCVEGKETSAG